MQSLKVGRRYFAWGDTLDLIAQASFFISKLQALPLFFTRKMK
jgi:hypothetical protein